MSPRKPGDMSQVPTTVGPLWVDRWDRGISKKLRSQGEYEPETTRWLSGVLRPGMVVVDIGANIGYYTVLFGRAVGAAGRVLAFEPDPRNREMLERNVRDNGLADRITISDAAVSDRHGREHLHVDHTYWGVHSLSAANLRTTEHATAVEVPTTTLDAAVAAAGVGRPGLVKIDAQGAEAAILRGATDTLGGSREVTVLLELWPFGLQNLGASTQDVVRQLAAWQFVPATLDKRGPKTCSWQEVEDQAAALSGHGSVNLVLRR